MYDVISGHKNTSFDPSQAGVLFCHPALWARLGGGVEWGNLAGGTFHTEIRPSELPGLSRKNARFFCMARAVSITGKQL